MFLRNLRICLIYFICFFVFFITTEDTRAFLRSISLDQKVEEADLIILCEVGKMDFLMKEELDSEGKPISLDTKGKIWPLKVKDVFFGNKNLREIILYEGGLISEYDISISEGKTYIMFLKKQN